MLTKLDLILHEKKKCEELSGGNKRKLSAAIALVAAPAVSFLDEPSSGMDVATRLNMWQTIRASVQAGTCVVLTTHSMEEVGVKQLRKHSLNKQTVERVFANAFVCAELN